MKAIRFYAIAALAATTLLASCSKDDNGPSDLGGEAATLNITIASSPTTKGKVFDETGDLLPGHDQTVSNFYVFVVNGVGNIITKQAVGSTTITLTTTTAASEVYVVANEPTAYDAAILDNVASKSDLEDLEVDLVTTGAGEQITKRWISGSTSTISWGTPNAGSATVYLKYIASRITVKVVDLMTPAYDHASPNLQLESVAVLNGNGTSKLFGSTLFPTTLSFYAGLDFPASPATPWAHEPSSTLFPALTDAFTYPGDFYDGASNKNVFYYYVFTRDEVTTATDFPTIVTLCGKYNGNDIYFPVHLASYDKLTGPMERGKSYDITITLKGDPTTGGGGTTDPTDPVIVADIEIILDVADWIPVTIGKEFS